MTLVFPLPQMERRDSDLRHISLNTQDKHVQEFLLSLDLDSKGTVLELNGEPMARVFPIVSHSQAVDRKKLKAAILERREESRSLNEAWQDADRELWELDPPADS